MEVGITAVFSVLIFIFSKKGDIEGKRGRKLKFVENISNFIDNYKQQRQSGTLIIIYHTFFRHKNVW